MSKPKLMYFDIAASRGEECRLALHLAGIDFDDVRVKQADWPALKPQTPFGSMPVLEIPGKPPLAHSNAILVYIGRSNDLHPRNDFEAAQHEAILCHVEDMRAHVSPTMRIKDEDEKKKAREALAEGYLPAWAAALERQISDRGPFFSGEKIQVVDLKIYLAARWFLGGKLDHIPTSVLAPFPKLNRVHDAVSNHEKIKDWYARG